VGLSKAFKALNDKTRREILELLKHGELTAGEIAERFDMTAPSISHHLDILRRAELVDRVKNGQFLIYSINITVLDDVMAWLMELGNKDKKKHGKK
jgi:ArsR family transcriptional regulator, arsenate/arsenite/antimonite-responsive transcriptional repressor